MTILKLVLLRSDQPTDNSLQQHYKNRFPYALRSSSKQDLHSSSPANFVFGGSVCLSGDFLNPRQTLVVYDITFEPDFAARYVISEHADT